MKAKRTIRARDLIADIQSRMTRQQLMEKYEVSPNQLTRMFRHLVDAGVIGGEDLRKLVSTPGEPLNLTRNRKKHRGHVFVKLPIFDLDNLLTQGTVVDISEKGLRISGIPANEGDSKEFVVQADYFADVYPFVFEATCKWSTTTNDRLLTGFRITKITEAGLQELRKLIHMRSLTD